MIFLDSSFIIAYSNEDDSLHRRALEIAKELDEEKYGTSVITDYIFDEVVTVLLHRTRNLNKAVATDERLLETTMLIRIDAQLFEETRRIFKAQGRHRLSFTDCSTIAVCRANGISTIATFDEELKTYSKFRVVD